MSTPTYKTSKKYKCPFCDLKETRSKLIDHVEDEHQDLIPETYTPARVIYDYINKKNYNLCMICKEKVYTWNPKINRYNNLCDKPECKAKVRQIALERHIRVHKKPSLLNDPEQQEKMLANRKISGTYVFRDGGKHTYTGKYEKNALEFIDTVLEIPSKDIQSPGPVLEYEYEPKKHFWITDIYYIPANLLIEVKDGGANPNNRSMVSYREKQIAKEKMVTELGTFNYIRLTDNDFSQLLSIFADMKNAYLIEDEPKSRIHINEEVGGVPPHRPAEAYIIPYGMNNVFDGVAYGNSETDSIIGFNCNDSIVKLDKNTFEETYDTTQTLIYNKEDTLEKINLVKEYIESKSQKSILGLMEIFAGRKLKRFEQIFVLECFSYYDKERENQICNIIENTQSNILKNLIFEKCNPNILESRPIIDSIVSDNNIIETNKNVCICKGSDGFYAITMNDYYLRSGNFETLDTLKSSNIIDIMNDMYESNRKEIETNG